MEKFNLGKDAPTCALAHGLINQLTVIIGFCDLVLEGTVKGPECSERLAMIRKVAAKMADDLNGHQCELEQITGMLVKNLPPTQRVI